MSNMVVCPEPPAAEVGRDIYAAGGNAVDAAIATAFAQAVTNPLLCGIGGAGLFHYYDAKTRQSVTLNLRTSVGSRPIPEHWKDEYLGRTETVGRYVLRSEANNVGYQSVMVPGFVRGCWTAYQAFSSGQLSWAELLNPAARLASEGFAVYPYIAEHWKPGVSGDVTHERPGYPGLRTKLKATSDAARIYLKADGSPYFVGDMLKQPELGETIRRLGEVGGEDFYTGEIAAEIAADFEQNDGFITAGDLAEYEVLRHEPHWSKYRGYDVASPRYSGGPHVAQILRVLEHFDLRELGHNTAEYVDTFARVQRATFADNVRIKGVPYDEEDRLAPEIMSAERAKYWADRIKGGDRIEVEGGAVAEGTTHLTAVDEERNIVSFTHTIGAIAGSGVVSPGLGFLYNNFLGHFNPVPGYPDSIEPKKRSGGGPPTIVYDNGKPYIAIGAPGGSRLFTSIIQVLVNAIDHGMDMESAVTVPRFHSEEKQLVFLEPAFSDEIEDSLREAGNEIERSKYMARVQAIRIGSQDGELEAGPDPRGGAGVGRYP